MKKVAGHLRIRNSTIEMLQRSTNNDSMKMNHVIEQWMNGKNTCRSTWKAISDIAHIINNERLLYKRFTVNLQYQ